MRAAPPSEAAFLISKIAADMSESDYERAVLWVPDPNSPAGWIRRKVWPADEPKRQKPPMGFRTRPSAETRTQSETQEDTLRA